MRQLDTRWLRGVASCALVTIVLAGCGGKEHSGVRVSELSPSTEPTQPGHPSEPTDPTQPDPPVESEPPAEAEPTSGSLNLNEGQPVRQYTPGTSVVIPLSLSGASNPAMLPVNITSSDPRVAAASPATCFLSSSSTGGSCMVTVRTAAEGSAKLTAAAPGYDAVTMQVVVGGEPPEKYNYGQVQLGAFPTAKPPSATDFPMTAQLGQIVTLQTSLTGFDQPLNGVPIFLSTTAGAFVGNPQCSVDSTANANHTCLYQLRLPSDAPADDKVVVTAHVVGDPASFQAWNAPTVTITTTSSPVTGTIVLETVDGSAPRGMSSPMWAVLRDSSGVGDTVVTLQPSDSNITINPGVAGATGAYQKLACTLSSASPVCGFGVKGEVAGAASISATANSGSYEIEPLSLTISEQRTAARVLKFRNTSHVPVWLGITSGTSNSYQTRAMVSASDPSSAGPVKMCGPSNPSGACPRGSTCQQGGANPDGDTTYFCYWDQPVPSNGYELTAGSNDATTVNISDSSYDPVADITWSGNFFPRERCAVGANGELTCEVADCGNTSSGSACAPGTGGAPAVATLPEVTLQRYGTDYYDISIIGGANVATSFGPDRSVATDSPIPDADNYFCATAGAADVQGALPGSDWNMAAHVEEPLVAGGTSPFSHSAQTALAKSSAFYQLVSTTSPREAPGCSTSNVCTTPGYVCGYDAAAVNHGTDSDYQTSCGEPVAWLSANQLWAMNTSASNAAPFRFGGTFESASRGTIENNQLFSCTAPTASGYDTANSDASRTCGCTNWGDASLAIADGDVPFASRVAAPSTGCATNNTVVTQHPWTENVLPTIAWLKKACPTCYTYPFDDMSSTFQCTNRASSAAGANSVPYVITFGGHLPGR